MAQEQNEVLAAEEEEAPPAEETQQHTEQLVSTRGLSVRAVSTHKCTIQCLVDTWAFIIHPTHMGVRFSLCQCDLIPENQGEMCRVLGCDFLA